MASEIPSKSPLELGREEAGKSRENALKEMEKLLDMHLASREYVESYGNAKAKALNAMSKYINRAYDILDVAMQNTDNVKDRAKWEDFLQECERDVDQYRVLIASFLAESAGRDQERSEKKLDLDGLFELTKHGREIFIEMSEDPHYGEIMKKILLRKEALAPEDYDFILAMWHEREPGPLTAKDSLELMKASGMISIMASMNGKERMKFMEYTIEKKREKALPLITSFTSGKYLTTIQASELLQKMQLGGEEVKAALAVMEEGQERTEQMLDNVHDSLRARMDTNLAIKFFQPKYLAGISLMGWRGANLLISVIAHRKKPTELLSSTWFYADVAGIIAGNTLLGNPTMWEWITKDTGSGDRELVIARAQLADRMMNAPDISKKYIEQDGVIEAIAFVRDKNREAKKSNVATLKEVLEAIRDPANAQKQFMKKLSPQAKENLQFAEANGDDGKVDEFMGKVAAIPYYAKTEQYRLHLKELKQLQGIAETEAPTKE